MCAHKAVSPPGGRDLQVADSLSAVEVKRLAGASREDIRLAGEIIGMAYAPDELKYGRIIIHDYSGGKRREVARIVWDGAEYDFLVAKKAGYADMPFNSTAPALNDEHLPKHLLPHFRQAAEKRGMGLAEYRGFLAGGGLEEDLEWLRLPHTVNFSATGHIISHNHTTLTHNICARELERKCIKDLVRRRMHEGNLRLRIKSCGCGDTGNEPYGYAMVARDVLCEVGREIDPGASEGEIGKWADGWDFSVTGYAISPRDLGSAEAGVVWMPKTTYERADRSNIFFKYVGESRLNERTHNYDIQVKPEIRGKVGFEWMDLMDPRQLERLRAEPADVLVLERVFYLYSPDGKAPGPSWIHEPMNTALGKIISAVAPGGLFITDNDAFDVRTVDYYAKQEKDDADKPPLYFRWPGLREVPWEGGLAHVAGRTRTVYPVTADEAADRDRRNNWDAYSRILRAYGDEITGHGGRYPSGIYLKA